MEGAGIKTVLNTLGKLINMVGLRYLKGEKEERAAEGLSIEKRRLMLRDLMGLPPSADNKRCAHI